MHLPMALQASMRGNASSVQRRQTLMCSSRLRQRSVIKSHSRHHSRQRRPDSDGRAAGACQMPNGGAQKRCCARICGACGSRRAGRCLLRQRRTAQSAVGDRSGTGAARPRPRCTRAAAASRCLIGSSPGQNISHLEAASGIAGLAKVLLALQLPRHSGSLRFGKARSEDRLPGTGRLDVVASSIRLPTRERPCE